ncbi:MAG: serine/threonine protein kinase [Myxococcota bacterium]
MAHTHYCPRCLSSFVDDPVACGNLSCGASRPKIGWGTLLHPGDALDRHYKVLKALAVGGAGLTYLAQAMDADGEPHGPKLAIKVLYQQRDQGSFLRRLNNEAQILQDLAHDNIVECRGFVQRTGHPPYLVTLFEHGGSLGAHLERHGPLPPQAAAGIMRQILLALDTAHQRAIVHRDLKPENVLLRARVPREQIPEVRVADFGIAKVHSMGDRLTRQGSFIGTPEFAAPEQFEGRSPSPATDVFAAGALLYALVTNEAPVAFTDRMDIEKCLDELEAQTPPIVPEEFGSAAERALLQRILEGMMQTHPDRRWTVQQVLVALDGLEAGKPKQTLRTIEVTSTPDDGPRTWQGDAPPATNDAPRPAQKRDWLGAIVGVAGPVLAVLIGVPLVAIGLLIVAAATGWFSGPQDPSTAQVMPAVVVSVPSSAPKVRDLSAPKTDADREERDRLTNLLTQAAIPMRDACGLTTPLMAEVRISARGRVRSVDVQSDQPVDQKRCVARHLRALRPARTTGDDVSMRISVQF